MTRPRPPPLYLTLRLNISLSRRITNWSQRFMSENISKMFLSPLPVQLQ